MVYNHELKYKFIIKKWKLQGQDVKQLELYKKLLAIGQTVQLVAVPMHSLQVESQFKQFPLSRYLTEEQLVQFVSEPWQVIQLLSQNAQIVI
jgi:hypothetical protein